MKLFVLRHEERSSSPLINTSLTDNGLNNSIKLSNLLCMHNINSIYSSPYLRCLQTISPYSNSENISINVELGLSEYRLFIFENDINNISSKFNINNNYKSYCDIKTLNSTIFDLHNSVQRISDVLINILKDNEYYNSNILICTHMSIVNIILFLFNKITYHELLFDVHQECGKLIEC